MRVRLATTVVHVPGTRMPSDGPPPGITHLTVAGFVGNTWLTPHAFPALDIIAILMNVSEEGAGAFGLLPQPAATAGTISTTNPTTTSRRSIRIAVNVNLQLPVPCAWMIHGLEDRVDDHSTSGDIP